MILFTIHPTQETWGALYSEYIIRNRAEKVHSVTFISEKVNK